MRCFPRWIIVIVLLLSPLASNTSATEPNENFFESTILDPGVLSVSDTLTPGTFGTPSPDTVLRVLGESGEVIEDDDDDSLLGDGRGSGVSDIPIPSNGTISFLISGYPDENFTGDHPEYGDYTVFVDVYDSFGGYLTGFSSDGSLQSGVVDDYSYTDLSWVNGSFDINIDNTVSITLGGDVDFFTFTGLPAGELFRAETKNLSETQIDTMLGWFDNEGELIEANDDFDDTFLSRLEGIVPENGTLTFAVTGYGDFEFMGIHDIGGEYSLELSFGPFETPGDFDEDGDVDGSDFLEWQAGYDGTYDAGDLSDWQANYGLGSELVMGSGVPEPSTCILGLLGIAFGCGMLRRYRNEP